MKGILLVCLVASLFIGCDRNPVEEFGEELMVSYERSSDAADEANRQAIQRYIRTYRALNGRYPESLEELEGSVGAGYDLGAYDYDPRTGSLTPN
jgi:hypothetical protein